MRFRAAATSFVFAFLITGPLAGCGIALFSALPINFVTTEVLPRAVNGKGLAEDGVDLATGKDCRLIEGASREDRKVCETRGSAATKKDFKGLSGVGSHDDQAKPH